MAHTSETPRTSFVQTARGMTFSDGTLVLVDVAPSTIFVAGHDVVGFQTTGQFLDAWYDAGSGPVTRSTAALISLLSPEWTDGTDARILLSLPRIQGAGLAYHVALLEGHLPASAGACVLFLDPPADPITPTGVLGLDGPRPSST